MCFLGRRSWRFVRAGGFAEGRARSSWLKSQRAWVRSRPRNGDMRARGRRAWRQTRDRNRRHVGLQRATTSTIMPTREGWKRLDFAVRRRARAHADSVELAGREEGGVAQAGESQAMARARTGSRETDAAGGPVVDEDPLKLLRRGTALLSRRLASLLERAEKGARLNKAEFDGLAAMSRVIERWETLAQERAKQEEKKSDEELADIYRRIEERIAELAREEAERLVAAGYRPGAGRRNRGKLVAGGADGAADDLVPDRGQA